MKKILLIRHGESLGQTAHSQGIDRQNDRSLKDCFLSQRGISQAFSLQPTISELHESENFDLICVSPLTRAIATCALGFSHLYQDKGKERNQENQENQHSGGSGCHGSRSEQEIHISLPQIICHPDLTESGGKIPENKGRPIKNVIQTIDKELSHHLPNAVPFVESIDFSLLPDSWPGGNCGQVFYFLEWLSQRPETNIAVVCHHNVIRSLLRRQIGSVYNCDPITCFMVDGDLRSLYIESWISDNEKESKKKLMKRVRKKK